MKLEKLLDTQISPAAVGFSQAIGVVVYTILIATFLSALDFEKAAPPEFVIAPLMMTLLVFSAAVTGTLVFGLPVYFTFAKNDVKRAISILGFTFLSLFAVLLLAVLALITIF